MTQRTIWSCTQAVLPFAVMVMIQCVEVSITTLVKVAMNGGMSSLVYVVYHNALGTLVLLPFFVIHIVRSDARPPLNFSLLCRFFILGLLGICLGQVSTYAGVYFSSPTLSSALGNLIPLYTLLLAICFRMEQIDIRSSSSRAKLLGTIVAISGAFVLTLYQGPVIFQVVSSDSSSNLLLLAQPSNWALGGLILVASGIFASLWNVLQTATTKEYPDQITIVFLYCLFGTIQCTILSIFIERNPTTWVLHPGVEMAAVAFGGLFAIAFRGNAITWCLHKKGPVFVAMFTPIAMVIAVIMGIMFLGDALHLGSVIGAVVISVGFYSVMWGKAKENDNLVVDMETVAELESSTHSSPLLSSKTKSKC